MKILGKFEKHSLPQEDIVVNIDNLNEGINDYGDFIIKKSRGSIRYVINKICDHNGGRLIVKDQLALCPNHNWKLNLNSLKYQESFVKKKPLEFEVRNNNLHLRNESHFLVNPFKQKSKKQIEVRWLNHACIHITNGDISLITDPWIFGPAFLTGWWLESPSPKDSLNLIKSANYILISHNHPDHLHAETLSILNRNQKIIIPNFNSKSTEVFLLKLGFNNLSTIDFLDIIEIEENFHISILKSGDFRDDSGFYFNVNGNEILLCVDANYLNSYVLPKDIDLLCTSFASGSSGFPLIYDNITEGNKSRVLFRNRKSAQKSISSYVEITTPKYYMPYAGMFKEKSLRDGYILENNKKNDLITISDLISRTKTSYIFPEKDKVLCLKNSEINEKKLKKFHYLESDDINNYLDSYKKEFELDFDKWTKYFEGSGYDKKQILHIIPTDDDFNSLGNKVFYVNFHEKKYFLIPKEKVVHEILGFNNMILKVRSESFMCLISNYLPWEDLTIGFQCRIERFPDVYESEFWYYFTNNYVNKQNIRHSSYCGACTLIDQNKLWYSKKA